MTLIMQILKVAMCVRSTLVLVICGACLFMVVGCGGVGFGSSVTPSEDWVSESDYMRSETGKSRVAFFREQFPSMKDTDIYYEVVVGKSAESTVGHTWWAFYAPSAISKKGYLRVLVSYQIQFKDGEVTHVVAGQYDDRHLYAQVPR